MQAAAAGHADIVAMLLEAGGDVNAMASHMDVSSTTLILQ